MNKNNSLIIAILIVIITMLVYKSFKNEDNKVTISHDQILAPNQQTKPIDNPNKPDYQIKPVPKSQPKLYIEEATNSDEFIIGSVGNQYRLMATSSTPARVIYTLKFNTAAVYPGAVVKDDTTTRTISLPIGTTKIEAFTSVNKPTVTYTIN